MEQKNGAVVRRLVGYGRFEGVLAEASLGRLYAAARLHGNLFPLPFKLREKRREGTRVIKRHDAPDALVMRVLTHAVVSYADKSRLRVIEAGFWAHVRREFVNVRATGQVRRLHKAGPASVAAPSSSPRA